MFSGLFLKFPITLTATYLIGIPDKLLYYGLFLPFLFDFVVIQRAVLSPLYSGYEYSQYSEYSFE